MASKAKGKGKNTPSKNTTSKRASTKEFEGAIDSNYYIRAQKKDGSWCDGRIITCRLLKGTEIKKNT